MCRFIIECVVTVVRHKHWAWLCACVRAHVLPLINTLHGAAPFTRYRLHQASPRASFSHFYHHSRVIPLIVAQAECCAALFRKKLRRKHCTRNADEAVAEPVLKPGPAPVQIPPLVGHSNSVFLLCPQLLPPG